jgi:hypothetical protein
MQRKLISPYSAFVPFASITAIFAVSVAGVVVAEKLYTKERHEEALPKGVRRATIKKKKAEFYEFTFLNTVICYDFAICTL